MDVRDLITHLLEYDMNAQVEILIESKEDTEQVSDFDFDQRGYNFSKYLNLTVNLNDSIILNTDDFNSLKDEKEELASTVEDLQSKLEDAEKQIDELERELDK